MREYDLRELVSLAYFAIYDDFRWYVRRGGSNKTTVQQVLSDWVKLMNPITPHLSEELNPEKGLVSISSWPHHQETQINLKEEQAEHFIQTTMDGMRTVLKLAKIEKPQKFTLFVAESWLYELFLVLHKELNVTRNIGEIMKKVLEQETLKLKGKEISTIVANIVKDPSRIPALVTSQDAERKVMEDAKTFMEDEFQCKIEMVLAEDSTHPKARSAIPGKVGILVE